MGTQQILLLILAILVVGIGIAVGINLFAATSASANKLAIQNDLMNLSQYAYRYKLTPIPLGGGGRAYTGFTIPQRLADTEDALYTCSILPQSITFIATSKYGYGVITGVLDSIGTIGNYSYEGEW